MALFAATVEPLDLIEWTEQAPAFNIKDVDAREQSVARQFTKPHIYYVGAYTRCACGFVYGQPFPPPDNEAEEAAARVSVAAYLRQPGQTEFHFSGLHVLRVEGGQLAEITSFGPALCAGFRLPPTL